MNRHSDIVVVGAGPAGLSFARTLADSGLRITIVEKSPLESISNPAYDGREIALTHLSKEIMERLGMWQRVPENEIYPLRDAKVWNGSSASRVSVFWRLRISVAMRSQVDAAVARTPAR